VDKTIEKGHSKREQRKARSMGTAPLVDSLIEVFNKICVFCIFSSSYLLAATSP